ncbi:MULTISPECIES: SCP2 domain-containing protein [unclassified Nitrosospira]|uniref:ubiquinone biosynthesis accessory factor UbiJ n=1 Tax=unclassified Nitrosospira TaxID=2609267 RepID=UPI000D315D3F|nr:MULTISPECIES: ubiquinone biosynthesis protein [unclassified Nitrosospira]PTR14737.1 ubiquinone biosynthesis protein UbiJ [Nitrosospira sp. Nsp2]WON73203.1 ubiquinone biosynthesis protein [Nitrosospira sp. Is2]
MLASLAIAPLNHLLHGESWARKRLQAYAGKTARFRLPPFIDLALTIKASGEVSTAPSNTRDDAILTVDPVLLPRLLARDEDAFRSVRVSGDGAFADEILHIGKNLSWNLEEDLSGIMGDILAHRAVLAGQSLAHWHTETIRNLLQMSLEYLTEERPLLAKPFYMYEFVHEVSALQEAALNLDKRVNALMKRPR